MEKSQRPRFDSVLFEIATFIFSLEEEFSTIANEKEKERKENEIRTAIQSRSFRPGNSGSAEKKGKSTRVNMMNDWTLAPNI